MALANLVTYDLMVGELSVGISSTDTDLQDFFNDVVEQTQRDILIKLLGVTLYRYYYNNEDETLTNGVKGGFYLNDNKYYEFRGLKEMLKYFVFFYYQKQIQSFSTSSGERKELHAERPEAITSLNAKLVKCWNKGVKLFNEAIIYINFINSSSNIYENFEPQSIDKLYEI